MNTIRLASLALMILAVSCRDATGPEHQIKQLDAARQRWRAQNLHTYAFTLQRSCYCLNVNPLYVAVLSDTVVGALDLETGEYVDRKLGETVDGLFSFVEHAIANRAHLIRVVYDPEQGFPTEIDYDGVAQAADDEIFYRVSNVHVIAPQLAMGSRVSFSGR